MTQDHFPLSITPVYSNILPHVKSISNYSSRKRFVFLLVTRAVSTTPSLTVSSIFISSSTWTDLSILLARLSCPSSNLREIIRKSLISAQMLSMTFAKVAKFLICSSSFLWRSLMSRPTCLSSLDVLFCFWWNSSTLSERACRPATTPLVLISKG